MALVTLFVRVNPAIRELLIETLRGHNASRPTGEPMLSLGHMVERCVLGHLAPGQSEGERVSPRQLKLPGLKPRRRPRGEK